ncbi:hypothetical protein CEJ76_19835, partial [Acinetobacter baumannii]
QKPAAELGKDFLGRDPDNKACFNDITGQRCKEGIITMLAYVIRRLWQMIPTMLGVVLLIFILFNWVGGDPAYSLAGKMSNPEQSENI